MMFADLVAFTTLPLELCDIVDSYCRKCKIERDDDNNIYIRDGDEQKTYPKHPFRVYGIATHDQFTIIETIWGTYLLMVTDDGDDVDICYHMPMGCWKYDIITKDTYFGVKIRGDTHITYCTYLGPHITWTD